MNESILQIITEYCPNGDLGKLIKHFKSSNKSISKKDVKRFSKQICSGLVYLHDKKVMHRDIKPDNIFLTECNECVIGDFGLSKLLGPASADTSSIVGSPLYQAPEILHQQAYTFAVDMWSFGCLIYELCTLEKPFIAKDITELIEKVSHREIKQIPKTYGEDLQKLVDNLITLEPKKRLLPYEALHDIKLLSE